MKEKLKRLTKKEGFSYVFICVLMVILLMIAALVWEFIRLGIAVSNTHRKLESAMTVVATEKYNVVYSTIRDGYASPYKTSTGSGWSNLGTLSSSKVINEALSELNAGEKKQVNKIKSIGGISCQYSMASSASNYLDVSNPDSYRYKAYGTFEVEIPFKFLWNDSFTVTLDAEAQWTSQFGTAYN